jgi:hypothetical protein
MLIKREHKNSVQRNVQRVSVRRDEKNEISDSLIEAEDRKEFDILCKTMGATDEDLAVEARTKDIIIGRISSSLEMKRSLMFDVMNTTVDKDKKEKVLTYHIKVAKGDLADSCLKSLEKGCLVCIEGALTGDTMKASRICFLGKRKSESLRLISMKMKSEKVHKVSSICKASANEDDHPIYKVSCITREHSATRKKYSGEFDSLQDAMKVCAQAYNAGVDVCVECGDQPFAKIYTKTKEFEDFTDDSSATSAFREAMMWSKSPERRKKDEEEISTQVPDVNSLAEMIPDNSVIPDGDEISFSESEGKSECDTDKDAEKAEAQDEKSETASDVNPDILSQESNNEDPNDIRIYAKNHQMTVMTEAHVNGVKLTRMCPGVSGKFNGRNRLKQ